MDTDKLPQNDDDRLNDTLEKELFKPWEKKLKEKFDKELKEKGCKGFEFVRDGALQGYSDQNFKILFIGREVHSSCTNIVEHVNGVISKWEGVDTCWKRAIWTAYGLLHGVECWDDDIPQVVKLKKEDGAEDVASFAVIEISKYANPDDSTALSSKFEKYAYESMGVGENVSSRNFTREEIEILNPDLIISWNLMDALGPCFLQTLTKTNASSRICLPPDITAWAYKFSSGREIPLLDTWHFSTRNKSPKDNIYIPIRKALKKLGVNFPLRPSAECGAK